MHSGRCPRLRASFFTALMAMACWSPLSADDRSSAPPEHPPSVPAQDPHEGHAGMDMGTSWHFMQDGILFGTLNHQGGPRGGTEGVSQNWWMGMASHEAGPGQLTLTGMLSLDPATVGRTGYGEIFQAGETLEGRPLVDRQHPHDFLMQMAAALRIPAGRSFVTLAAAPAGEPAIGPPAFIHRASASDNATAPLSHHLVDSTHVSFGVLTAAVERGRIIAEGSLFNAREPDEDRWDLDPGPLDSIAGRLSIRPAPGWDLQISSARMKHPERLEPGTVVRTTASASWLRTGDGDRFAAVTLGYGQNSAGHGRRHALFAEVAASNGPRSVYSRVEWVQLESGLFTSEPGHGGAPEGHAGSVVAATVGAVHEVGRVARFQGGVGADVTFYHVPDALTVSHGRHPVSVHVFFRVRLAPGPMGRMWNMQMGRPMAATHE